MFGLDLWGLLTGAGGVVMALVLAWWQGRRSGRDSERVKQNKRVVEAYENRRETDDEVARLGPDSVRKRMRDWQRD